MTQQLIIIFTVKIPLEKYLLNPKADPEVDNVRHLTLVYPVHSLVSGIKDRFQMNLGLVFDAHGFDEVLAFEEVLIVYWYVWTRAFDVAITDTGVNSESVFTSA